MVSGTIIDNVKDALAAALTIIESAESEILWILPTPLLVLSSQFNVHEKMIEKVHKGVSVRGITSLSSPYLETVREIIKSGQQVRDVQGYVGTFMVIGDRKQSISSIYIDVPDISLDDNIVAFWTFDPDYANYLISSFDDLWKEAIEAEKRISELTT
jgi:sugar-specific transcriptional regulator TrmB